MLGLLVEKKYLAFIQRRRGERKVRGRARKKRARERPTRRRDIGRTRIENRIVGCLAEPPVKDASKSPPTHAWEHRETMTAPTHESA